MRPAPRHKSKGERAGDLRRAGAFVLTARSLYTYRCELGAQVVCRVYIGMCVCTERSVMIYIRALKNFN